MIHNTKNRSNDTIEGQKEKRTCFNAHTEGNEIWHLAMCYLEEHKI